MLIYGPEFDFKGKDMTFTFGLQKRLGSLSITKMLFLCMSQIELWEMHLWSGQGFCIGSEMT